MNCQRKVDLCKTDLSYFCFSSPQGVPGSPLQMGFLACRGQKGVTSFYLRINTLPFYEGSELLFSKVSQRSIVFCQSSLSSVVLPEYDLFDLMFMNPPSQAST